ncbi:MAG: ATP-dependent zinc metalloprotease FtsH [Flavobacteriales bacterium]|nr:ATP-dependent zinc metalloprotease FtsH [Flavobacteriales bacterium]
MKNSEQENVGNGGKPEKPGKEKPRKVFNLYWIYGVVIVIILSLQLFTFGGKSAEITFGDFKSYVEGGDVDRVVIITGEGGRQANVFIKKDSLSTGPHAEAMKKEKIGTEGFQYFFNMGGSDARVSEIEKLMDQYAVRYNYRTDDTWGKDLLGWILPFGILIVVWLFIMRRMGGAGGPGGQIFNIGKSRAQVFEGSKTTNTTFNDVAGLDEAKEELEEIVDFLKSPKKYTDLGAKIPKGALLVGPPGTGKTLLAKAVAGEAEVPFFSLSGSDFVEMFVGVGASRVRDLFKQAKEKAPAIIFIDEIDAIGRARGRSASMGANDERENTLNQLLTEMDGFGTNSGVILLGATNRADVLDRALMRPGRFDRQIYVDMPDLNERVAIFKVHLKPLKLDLSVDVEFLAKQTPGFSGADIANICNEGALIAARRKKKVIDKQDFLDAVDRVIGGLEKKNKIITQDEKRAIAFHEAGHATVSWLIEHASPLVKVTIVPRGNSLGAAWYLPEERHLTTTEQMLDEICAALGGRAAEDIMFNKVSTGALSDLEKVTKQAMAMVSIYGLNDRIGNISYYDSSGQGEYNFGKPYSEQTAQTIDQEVSKIIEGQYARAKRILAENKDKLTALADQLLEKEVIFKEDLETIFGKRAWEREEAAPTNGAARTATEAPAPAPATAPAPAPTPTSEPTA